MSKTVSFRFKNTPQDQAFARLFLEVEREKHGYTKTPQLFTLPMETGERIEQALAQRVCTALDGSYIRRSSGRRRTGRPAKYTVHVVSDDYSFVVQAMDDGTAVELANQRIATRKKVEILSYLVSGICTQKGKAPGRFSLSVDAASKDDARSEVEKDLLSAGYFDVFVEKIEVTRRVPVE